jgi:hypothetical protein
MHSRLAMRMLCASSLIVSGCALVAKKPEPTKVDLKWQFCEIVPSVKLACLPEEDVVALRKALLECKAKP